MNNDYYEEQAPIEEPISLDYVKSICRITHSNEDALLTTFIHAAREKAEMITNRLFIGREVTGYFQAPCYCQIIIRRAPLISISAVYDGAELIPDSEYDIQRSNSFSRVSFDESLGATSIDFRPITINFTAGYGAAQDVPQAIRDAIAQTVCYWYSNRGDCEVGSDISGIAKRILTEFRIVNTYG